MVEDGSLVNKRLWKKTWCKSGRRDVFSLFLTTWTAWCHVPLFVWSIRTWMERWRAKKKHQKTVKMDQLRHCQATMCSNVWSLLRLSQMLSLSYRQLGQLWSGRTEDLKMWIRMKWAPSPSRASSESNKTWTWRLALLTSAYRLQEINLPKMQFLEELPNCLNT